MAAEGACSIGLGQCVGSFYPTYEYGVLDVLLREAPFFKTVF